MEVNVGSRSRESNRLSVGDEMDLVSTLGQLQSKFGCYHTTASVRGIAGNTDFQVRSSHVRFDWSTAYKDSHSRQLKRCQCSSCLQARPIHHILIADPAF